MHIAHLWISFSIRTPYLRKEREEWLLMHIVSYPSFLAVSGTFDTWTVSGCQKSPQSSCMPNNHQGGLIPGLFHLKKNRFHFFEMFSNRHFGGMEKYCIHLSMLFLQTDDGHVLFLSSMFTRSHWREITMEKRERSEHTRFLGRIHLPLNKTLMEP